MGRVILGAHLAVCMVAAAQNSASISGRVTDLNGVGIGEAPIQALNIETNAPYRTLSGATGEYSIPGLPAGTYKLTLNYPGFRYTSFTQNDVRVSAGVAIKIEIKLGDNNYATLGD